VIEEKKNKILSTYFYSIIIISIVIAIPNVPGLISISLLLLMLGGAVFFQVAYYFYFRIQLNDKIKELYPEFYTKYKSLNRDGKTYSIYIENIDVNVLKKSIDQVRSTADNQTLELFIISKKCIRFGGISVFIIIGIVLLKLILKYWLY